MLVQKIIGVNKICGLKKKSSSPIKGRRLSQVIFYQRSFSIKNRLPSKVDFHQMPSSIKGCIPSKVVFRQRSSSNLHQMVFIKQIGLKINFNPFHTSPVVRLLGLANSVQLNQAQTELAIWETSWWMFRQLVRLHWLSRLTLLFTIQTILVDKSKQGSNQSQTSLSLP